MLGIPEHAAPLSAAACAERQGQLDGLTDALERALLDSSATRHELWLWLVTSLSQLGALDAPGLRATKQARFRGVLRAGLPSGRRGRPSKASLALAALLCEGRPAEVGAVLAGEPELLRRFFEGSARRITLYFAHFSIEGLRAFRLGAAALARFALQEREEVWEHLVWEGKHPQAPIAVAAKPHYFCELDIVASVRNLLRACPRFLRSEAFRESLQPQALLAIDQDFWAEEICELLATEEDPPARRLAALLDELLAATPMLRLAGRALPLLGDAELAAFATQLLPLGAALRDAAPGAASPVEAVLFGLARWRDLDTLLLANALALHPARLGELLEEGQPAHEAVRQAGEQLLGSSGLVEAFWPFVRDTLGRSRTRAALNGLLELWLLRRRLEALCSGGEESVASLLGEQGISFSAQEAKAFGGYELVGKPSSSSSKRKKRAKKAAKKRKKRRRRGGSSGSSEEEQPGSSSDSDGFGGMAGAEGLGSGGKEWTLTWGKGGREARCKQGEVAGVVWGWTVEAWTRVVLEGA